MVTVRSGPLSGTRVVEMAAIGPAPFAAMMLADHGAEVIRIDRPGAEWSQTDVLLRSRRSIELDLKNPGGVAVARRLIASADALLEGFRPGVMERMGLGPEICLGDNPRLVYGRMTGWGQTGPLASAPGHDINYISVAGALHAFGRAGDKPTPPINLVGDFGGGGMMLAFGVVSALLNVKATGQGQTIDVAMTDGAAVLMSMIWGMKAAGRWQDARGVNLLDTGAYFYDCYLTRDGKFISLGCIEPQFYRAARDRLGLTDPDFDAQQDPAAWPRLRAKLADLIRQRTRDEWSSLLEGTDACFAPVLSMAEAPDHPHNRERRTFVEVGGVTQPAPAPRYCRTQTQLPEAPQRPGTSRLRVLSELGYTQAEVRALAAQGAFGPTPPDQARE